MQVFSQMQNISGLGLISLFQKKIRTQLLIKNYFDATEKPTLISPDGKQAVDADLVNSLSLLPRLLNNMHKSAILNSIISAEPIGVVAELKGTVFKIFD